MVPGFLKDQRTGLRQSFRVSFVFLNYFRAKLLLRLLLRSFGAVERLGFRV